MVQLVVPQQNVWSMAPQFDPNDHPIHLSSDVIYTLFPSNYVIPSNSLKAAITSKREALDPKKRHEVFGAFFNMNKIRQALASRKLSVKYRFTYSNRHIIHVLGFRYKQDKSKSIAHTTSSDKEDVNMDTGEASSSTSNVAKKGVELKAESKDLLKGKGAQGKGRTGTGKSRRPITLAIKRTRIRNGRRHQRVNRFPKRNKKQSRMKG
ncbi:hypothetical protein BDA99DRAFT_185638 [Phascolomyces articulosus]|uniref:Uncharacterized protein n=1 Tax=Phascolomyces articulosus TaxID=60185 RepID=A0AAD5JSB2_9FUNG|nr:hypothetical protein BDA99DRAFT_185638 [Phascolomyces articulosus]